MDATIKFLTALAGIVEGIALDDALRIMEKANDLLRDTPHPLTSHEGRMQAGRENDKVVQALREGKKIVAIKELRTFLTGKGVASGLKECKEAIDALVAEFPQTVFPAPRYDSWGVRDYRDEPAF